MPYPRAIPHGDGAGVIDRVGSGVPSERIGDGSGATAPRAIGRSARRPSTWCRPRDLRIRCPALLFKNITLHFLGSYDFAAEAKDAAAAAINALMNGWPGLRIAHRLPLAAIADAHELVERGRLAGGGARGGLASRKCMTADWPHRASVKGVLMARIRLARNRCRRASSAFQKSSCAAAVQCGDVVPASWPTEGYVALHGGQPA